MSLLTSFFLILAFFCAIKAVEHRGDAPMYPMMSWGAWLFLVLSVIASLVHSV